MSVLDKDYAKDAVDTGQASGAPIKRSTYGATVAGAVLAILAMFDGPFEQVFGDAASPWLRFAVFAVIVGAWAVIMVADTIARRVPSVSAPAPAAAPAATWDIEAEIHKFHEAGLPETLVEETLKREYTHP